MGGSSISGIFLFLSVCLITISKWKVLKGYMTESLLTWAANQNIIIISEGSCDTEDTDFDQINAALLSIRYFFLKYKKKVLPTPNLIFSQKW